MMPSVMSSAVHPASMLLVAGLFALVPVVMGLFTAYLKVSVVLGMVRSALGTQHTPSGLVIMALSLSLTGYTMMPVIEQCVEKLNSVDVERIAKNPSVDGLRELLPAVEPVRAFLERHSGAREISVLRNLSVSTSAVTAPEVNETTQVPLQVLLPAFVLTELKEAFAMAFVLLLPFLIIDLIVANILVGMGMMMVSPIMVALPLKLILLVMSDGWLLIARGLLQSYQ